MMTVDQLTDRLDELPADLEIVAYCRGAYCVFAHDAVRLLAARGRRAARLADGMLEWRLADLPVESSAPDESTAAARRRREGQLDGYRGRSRLPGHLSR